MRLCAVNRSVTHLLGRVLSIKRHVRPWSASQWEIRLREQEVRAANAERALFENEEKKLHDTQRTVIAKICESAGHQSDCDQWIKAELDRYIANAQKRTPAAAQPSPRPGTERRLAGGKQ